LIVSPLKKFRLKSKRSLTMEWPPQLPRLNGSDHAIYTFVLLLAIILAKLIEGRLQMVICSPLSTILFWQRLTRLTGQLTRISKGDFTFPSLTSIVGSLAIFDFLVIVWGFWLFGIFVVHANRVYSFVDCTLLSFLLSQTLFLALAVVHQILLLFFFPTCIRRGFFLFSILPRFVAGARTFFVTFLWFDAIRQLGFAIPVVLETFYLILKLFLFVLWVSDFVRFLVSKDFPPEFGTLSDSSGFTCPVCMDNVTFYIQLPCSHHFCVQCFCKWAAIHLNCPVCRQECSSWIHQVQLQQLYFISLVILWAGGRVRTLRVT
jgi:hypothetical protein